MFQPTFCGVIYDSPNPKEHRETQAMIVSSINSVTRERSRRKKMLVMFRNGHYMGANKLSAQYIGNVPPKR